MAGEIDNLQISIDAQSQNAGKNIDKLIGGLEKIKGALSAFSDDASVKTLDSLGKGFQRLNSNIAGLDSEKIKQTANSLNSMTRAIKTLSGTLNDLDFTHATSGMREFQTGVRNLNNDIADTFGIKNKSAIGNMRKDLENFFDASGIMGIDNLPDEEYDKAMKSMNKYMTSYKRAVKENASFQDPSQTAYGDLLDYMEAQNRSHNHVYLPFDPSEFTDDYRSMRATLGKMFTSDKSFSGSTDIVAFVNELNSQLGNIVPVANNAQDTFVNLVNTVKQARDSQLSYSQAIKMGIVDEKTLSDMIFNSTHKLMEKSAALKAEEATTPRENSFKVLAESMRELEGINIPDVSKFTELITAISKLGHKSMDKAIDNLPKLADGLRKVIETLSKAPQVSESTIRLTNALSKLASQGSKVQSASKALGTETGHVGKGFSSLRKGTHGIVRGFAKLYGQFFLITRAIRALWKSVESAMDYVETLNYFQAAFKQVASSAVGQWKEAGYESAESYAKSFEERAASVTQKMTGFDMSEEGQLLPTAKKSLGLNPTELMNYQAVFAQMSNSMGVSADTSMRLSEALTKIGADLASVKNMNFNQVWTDMQSGLAGMSRTLDKYGVNIRNVNMQERLHELGINANIMALNQNDKALLRTIILLDSSRYAWGDLANTINQPANQLRLVKASFSNLARTIGELFIPVLAHVLPIINAVLVGLQRLAHFVGTLLGVKFQGSNGGKGGGIFNFEDDAIGMNNLGSAATGAGKGLGGAAKKAKELKDHLLGIDELNVVNKEDPSSPGGGGGGGGGGIGGAGITGALEDALNGILEEYNSVWNQAFDEMEERANVFSDNVAKAFKEGGLYGVGEFFATSLREQLDGIDWESIYHGADTFGIGLADFLNGTIQPSTFKSVGKTVAGGLNTALHSVVSFGREFDFGKLGESLAGSINGFFESFDWKLAGEGIVVWAEGLFSYFTELIGNIDYLEVVVAIGKFFSGVFSELLEDISDPTSLVSSINPITSITMQLAEKASEELGKSGIAELLLHSVFNNFPGLGSVIDGVKLGAEWASNIAEAWNKVVAYWKEKPLLERITTTIENIKEKLSEKWESAKEWFNTKKEALSTVETKIASIRQALSEKWSSAKEWWENLRSGLSTITAPIENFVSKMKSAWGDLTYWWKYERPSLSDIVANIKLPHLVITWDTDGAAAKALQKLGLNGFPNFSVKYYQNGGYPSIGDLFFANENGVPELVGSIGGKPAVASGTEITGISNAVYETGAQQCGLLGRAVEILERIDARSRDDGFPQNAPTGYSFT